FRTVVRSSIQDFFRKEHAGNTPMLETVFWLLFETYNPDTIRDVLTLYRCPHCGTYDIRLERDRIRPDWSWEGTHPMCRKDIYIIDLFGFSLSIDNETGSAEGITGYLKNLIETFLIIHMIRRLMEIKEGLVDQFLFVKDGPLSFGGLTSNLHRPMQT